MFASSKSGSVDAKDAQFKNVTMLLHGNGTNGAQNNTFVDSSTNNFTITRNGNTTQGTFTPYGSNWSNYFDGSGDNLTLTNNSTLALSNASAFCVEFFAFVASTSNTPYFITAYDPSSGSPTGYSIRVNSGNWEMYDGTSWASFGTCTTNSWIHVAVSYEGSGTTRRYFLNGVQQGSAATVPSTISYTGAGPYYIGNSNNGTNAVTGYISNLRVVKGSAVYTSAFTPPTAPLTAITNTQLLTCQSNRLIDNSANAFVISKAGDTSVQRFSPFSPTTAYSTSVIGGSSYMDGSGDYLYLPNNSALSFGTGDFCVEAYVYKQRAANEPIIDSRATNNAAPWAIYIDGSNFPYFYEGTLYTSTIAITLNAWTHVAVTRSSGTLRIFVNGVQGYSATVTTNLDRSGGNQVIGATVVTFANTWLGYMNDLRIVKGSAVYTSAFTPPTAPLTAITNTSLLLNYTNAGILDNAMMNDLETVGNAQISTSVKKYGTGSMYFDGTGDYLQTVDSPNVELGGGNFTLEAWIYPTSLTAGNFILSKQTNVLTASAYAFRVLDATSGANASKLAFYASSNGSTWDIVAITATTALSINTWYHVAVTRSGSSFTIWLNGVSDGTGTSSTAIQDTTNPLCIGAAPGGGGTYTGYIDDLRITKGVARYTSTFTPPTAAFPDKG